MDNAPYLMLRGSGGALEVSGRASCRIANGRVDTPQRFADAWAAWQWDGSTLTVSSDRHGFQPLYYWHGVGVMAVAPCLVTLLQLGAPRDLDMGALAVFIRLGYFVGSDTAFRGLSALPRGGTLTWSDGRIRVTSDVDPPLPTAGSRAQAMDGFIELTRAAVRRRLPAGGESWDLPLSGGRDSRHLLFELAEAGHRPRATMTVRHYPPRGNEDAAVAPAIASAVGLPHVVLPQTAPRAKRERQKNLLTGFGSDQHVQFVRLAEYLTAHRTPMIYDGLLGDVLTATHHLRFAEAMRYVARGQYEEAARSLMRRAERRVHRMLTARAARDMALEVAVPRVAAALERAAGWPYPWGAFWRMNRTARSVALAPFAILARATVVVTPLLDPELLAFMSGVPGSFLVEGEFHEEALRRAHPRHAHLPFDGAAKRPTTAPGFYLRFYLAVCRAASWPVAGPLVDRQFVRTRALAAAVQRKETWFDAVRALYLLQLEEVAQGRELAQMDFVPTGQRQGRP